MSQTQCLTRQLVEMQGYYGIDDSDLARVDLGLRVSPLVCASIGVYGAFAQSATVFAILTVFAWLGALLPRHPFDVFYDYGLRPVIKGPPLPRNSVQRRFSCAFASVMLVVTTWLFASGAMLAGQVLGWLFVAAALTPVLTGFCIPSFIYTIVGNGLPHGLPGLREKTGVR